MELNQEQKTAFSYAVEDIMNGHLNTLWVNRLKKEYPKMYEYALNQNTRN